MQKRKERNAKECSDEDDDDDKGKENSTHERGTFAYNNITGLAQVLQCIMLDGRCSQQCRILAHEDR